VALSSKDPAFLASLGRRVREVREQRGMARKALSRASQVSERYLAALEAGEGNASVILLRRVAAALGVRLARDEALRERVREGGYRYLESHHSLTVAQAAMRRVLGIA